MFIKPKAHATPMLLRPSARFGGQSALPDQLNGIAGAPRFWQGVVPLKTRRGDSVDVSIVPVEPQDAAEVDDWYNPKPPGEPTYAANMKWRDWWRDVIKAPPPNTEVLKLMLPNRVILGVVALHHSLVDITDGLRKTYLNGIRIHPRCNSMMTSTPDYTGVGAALTTHGVIESLKKGAQGFFLNATLGAEGFYRKLGLDEKPALDGIRQSFYLNGESKLLAFLNTRFQKYAARRSPGS
jgi:hypothetical protein